MTVNVSPFGPLPQFELASGAPAVGYQLFFYVAGSNTKQNTYTDSTGGVANTNPIILNALGQPANQIWFTAGLVYKVVYAPIGDTDPPSSPIWTVDNVRGINDTTATFDQWVNPGLAPTFVSATQFTLVGDQTTNFHVGRRLKTLNTSGTIYSTITNSVYGAATTITVVNDSGVLDNGLSSVSYGLLTSTNTSIPVFSPNILAINSGQISGFRNSFINGVYQVSQVNGDTAVTITAGAAISYAIDQWYTQSTGQNITAQRIAGTSPFKYGYKLLAGATGATTTLHGTRIEGKDCVKDVNQTKGISLWMTHDVARTVTWTAYFANAEDNFAAKTQIATGTIAATAARAQYFFSFNAGANASNGLCIEYTTGALTNSTGYVIYEGHQNERVSSGATAGTSYEHVDYAVVLPRCQRYLPVYASSGTSDCIATMGASTTNAQGGIQFHVITRVPITGFVLSSTAHVAFANTGATFAMSALAIVGTPSVRGCQLSMTIATVGATPTPGIMYFNNAIGLLYFIGAQL